eukprot:gb/GFBE01003424.1/.p1 GENE.gb/GFBE01003424.1/~~gb/GFBE01003424.1/.p1  ORF type:complete len:147 (+),score=23.66 gb/GFBE01003424.1/:1-441(+)
MPVLSVALLSGEVVAEDLHCSSDDTVLVLLRKVQLAMDGVSCRLCTSDGRILRKHALLEHCKLADGDVLTAIRSGLPPPIAPERKHCCHLDRDMCRDVSIGAQHEGWGRKWSTCSYECNECQEAVTSDCRAVVCRACKSFWHAGCV